MKFISFFVLAAILLCTIQAAPISARIPLLPSEDDFYRQPSNFSSYNLGDIIKVRQTPYQLRSIYLAINVKNSWQIMARLSDTHGKPTTVVSTIIEPYNADNTKLVSYQIAQDAAADRCAPSYSILYGANLDTIAAQLEMFLIQVVLNEGWWVVIPDYEGPGLAFTAGRISGKTTLDSIRAVVNGGSQFGLDSNPQVALWGYSGGTIASGWAAALQPTYAPDLSKYLVGVALGGFVTNITETVVAVDNTLYAGLVPNGINGLAQEYPQIYPVLDKYIKPQFRRRFNVSGEQCLADSIVANMYSSFISGPPGARLWLEDGHGMLQVDVVQEVLNNVTIGLVREEMPLIPVFVYHGLEDGIVPSANTFRVYNIWKSQGIKSMEVSISNSTRHLTELFGGAPAAFAWLKMAFNKKTINGTLFTYRATNLEYPGASLEMIRFLLGAVKTVFESPLGPILSLVDKVRLETRSSTELTKRGFEDYDEILDQAMREHFLRKRAQID